MNNPQKETPGSAVASLVLGILGMILIGPLGAIPAIICGHLARTKIKQKPHTYTGDGLAVAGLVLGYVSLVIFAVVVMVYASLMVPNLTKGTDSGDPSAASRTAIAVVSTAIDLYETDTGKLPNNLDSLLVKSSELNWNGPYLRESESLLDGWGTPLDYKPDGYMYTVVSAGPDCIIGTSDDIK